MVRMQIYLTEDERLGLRILAKSTGRKQADLIREAVDRFLAADSNDRRKDVLNKAAALWEKRNELPEFGAIRRTLDRS